MPDFAEVPLLVAFISLNRYTAQVERLDDRAVASVMSRYYELLGAHVATTGGRLVKFIGDAALVAYPPDSADTAVLGFLDLKDAIDRFMAQEGWECCAVVKAHYGTMAAGEFGSERDRRFDILGKTVNIAARLESHGVALSAEAFRQLGPDVRRRFKKHTPPVTYIRQEDSHRLATKRY